MKKGFSLIETIVYVSLLSLLLLGVFSSILSFTYSKKEQINQNDYELLIENYHEK
ncbi:MAG: prepilin-type N-terminal cleavage/methylation domain-containing protein [Patescibacteria group bacterium]